MNTGIVYASLAYVMWGLFPIYFRALEQIPAGQILLHRMVWALLFLFLILSVRGQWDWLRVARRDWRLSLRFSISALLLATNWFVYIWACNNGHVLDASLGYFINPLVNVFLAALVLRERLRPGQWLAVAIAALGVLWLTWQAGHPPWIGLTLAFSFGSYGLLRKTASLGALDGLALETLLLFPFALAALGWLAFAGENAFVNAPASTRWLLVAAGPITAVPLLLFAAAARRIPFALLGFLQYMGPSLQLALGVWLYDEPFGPVRVVGFALIWLALVAYTGEGFWIGRRSARRTSITPR